MEKLILEQMKETAINQVKADLFWIESGAVEYDVTPTYYNVKGKLILLADIGIITAEELRDWEEQVNKQYSIALKKAEVK